MTASSYGNAWQMVPSSTWAGVILALLFVYLFFRHMLFVLMVMDLVLGWLRQFRWFPKEGRRLRTLGHWAVALGLFLGFLAIGGTAGWLKFIPQ